MHEKYLALKQQLEQRYITLAANEEDTLFNSFKVSPKLRALLDAIAKDYPSCESKKNLIYLLQLTNLVLIGGLEPDRYIEEARELELPGKEASIAVIAFGFVLKGLGDLIAISGYLLAGFGFLSGNVGTGFGGLGVAFLGHVISGLGVGIKESGFAQGPKGESESLASQFKLFGDPSIFKDFGNDSDSECLEYQPTP